MARGSKRKQKVQNDGESQDIPKDNGHVQNGEENGENSEDIPPVAKKLKEADSVEEIGATTGEKETATNKEPAQSPDVIPKEADTVDPQETAFIGGLNTNMWEDLESDPGVFTRIMEELGVKGVQADEVYDIPTLAESLKGTNVHGLIFCFKFIEPHKRGRQPKGKKKAGMKDALYPKDLFYAKQTVTNACAMHALLGVLLNKNGAIDVGQYLIDFKNRLRDMTPKEKGVAIGNSRFISLAHNKRILSEVVFLDEPLKAESKKKGSKKTKSLEAEAFHFISYVPVDGHLFELDGLMQNVPLDHGEIPHGDDWMKMAQLIISKRIDEINKLARTDERYNLMAIVPAKLDQLRQSLDLLKANKEMTQSAMAKLTKTIDLEKEPKTNGALTEDAHNGTNDLNGSNAPLSITNGNGDQKTMQMDETDDRSYLTTPISGIEIKIIMTYGGKSVYLDAKGLASSMSAIVENIGKIERSLDEEMKLRQQWKDEEERRKAEYVTAVAEQEECAPPEKPTSKKAPKKAPKRAK